MTRVLHVVSIMNYGGIENFIMNLYRNIDRNLYQFDFAVHSDEKGIYDDDIKYLGGRIYHIGSKKKFLKYMKSIKKIMNATNYEIVHIHLSSPKSFVTALIMKLLRVKNVIVHAHGSNRIDNLYNTISRLILNIVVDHRLACSLEAGEWVFGRNKKFIIVYNGIQTSKFIFSNLIRDKVRSELGLNGKVVIGTVGSLRKIKNHTFVLDIIKKLNDKDPNKYLFIIVGEGPEKESLKKKCNHLAISNCVMFLGNRNDVPNLLMGFDIFIFPSIREGFGIALLEAQASGLPCLASKSVPQITNVSGYVKYLELSISLDKWTSAIKDIDNSYLPDRSCAYKTIIKKKYDIENTVRDIVSLYKKMK